MSSSTTVIDFPSVPHPETPTHIAGENDIGCYFPPSSPLMARVRTHVERVAAVDVPVLLHGESGVGKEVFARLIHRSSPRVHRTFLKVNCAALPPDLLESELFGYEAGAFTGAVKSKPGKFELCNKGTILLDEIGEIPPPLQAKLLQVLQDRQFSRLGGRSLVSVDVRILAATNVNIQQALATKKLRSDLYYRLSAFVILIPPLRERRDEIPHLLNHFMEKFAVQMGRVPKRLSPHEIDVCLRYSWPGNVRELENFVKRYLILDDEEASIAELTRDFGYDNGSFHELPSLPRLDSPTDLKGMVRRLKEGAERQAIVLALERAKGNRKEAARSLNISTKALIYKMRQYGISDNGSTTVSTWAEEEQETAVLSSV
jgi:two-component system, NtrC family, response regulator AtoC